MSVLDLTVGSALDRKLTEVYHQVDTPLWQDLIKSLDKQVVDVGYTGHESTRITFKSEEDKLLFILRWS